MTSAVPPSVDDVVRRVEEIRARVSDGTLGPWRFMAHAQDDIRFLLALLDAAEQESPVSALINEIRTVAAREGIPDTTCKAGRDVALEDTPEITWQELAELSALLRRAATRLIATQASAFLAHTAAARAQSSINQLQEQLWRQNGELSSLRAQSAPAKEG